MDIEVLGCHGEERSGFFTPSLLLDGHVLLEAGSFACALAFRRQVAVDHILVSHAHHDHLRDLPAFADLIIGHRRRPVVVHASQGAMDILRRDLFNNRLWPDFFSLPSPEAPILVGRVFGPHSAFGVGGLRVRAIPVNHPGEAVGFLVRGGRGSFLYSGDTGPTQALWLAANRVRDLRLALVETKFPNDLQMVADAAGHLTPRTLERELGKLRAQDLPVALYHVKPDRFAEVRREVRALGRPRVRFLEIGDRFRL
ncbi:MAG TPA: 3',5'-cyclic-nucleotide phosphodiesterase [Myxococcota bacterium]|nr:3',5'-cyclic-nucleotide phosphodiesterase [Myxococcota bacterium]HRY94801.1 3',5'-cyclic-nucleotide phosphodiesterase [Myxococcota bacterium]HSA21937.1 3',5'-cyclic-nucleotide phosphodiesterase [Myxococcota bacterium]